MEDESRVASMVKCALGAVGLGAVAAVVLVPQYGIWIALAVVILFLLLFGGYFLWRRMRARRQRERFSAAIEAQTSAAPQSISDPNSRAKLDQLRQKFQKGLHEFKSRGKDLYKLPWYVIIGEPGSGKTEALRHSGIEFPPGMQDELQGSGGTVNMDWWFTNRAIILDTAGSMIFNEARATEAPEWREFLRLLKKARPQCPVNGLFLVLSIESLIKDSADVIAQKASRLAQQLDLIQRTLDVRFPVYLLVTKCDLLTGFREFFDNVEDPLLQHQMFGWSNPSPLDEHFRTDLVEQHLKSITDKLRRRRLGLLRDASSAGRLGGDTSHFFASTYQLGRGPAPARRLDEVDAMFALPESIMRLAPRLRRYLETIFVAGEWSAKPVFLRGIYFTTSMREGKTLDEAIALATGLPLDQLPEDRSWEKNRAYFLRDLFHEKVFRESGLVTHATNTLKLLRTRQLAIFGSAGAALLLLLGFAWYGNHKLRQSVTTEARVWKAAAATTRWNSAGEWVNGSIVSADTANPKAPRYTYAGSNLVEDTTLTVVQYHKWLAEVVNRKLSGGWIFKPISWLWIGKDVNDARREGQRLLFEAGVLRPLIGGARRKLQEVTPDKANAISRHADALLSLLQLEVDKLAPGSLDAFNADTNAATRHLKRLISYLVEDDRLQPDPDLVAVYLATFPRSGSGSGEWPPKSLLGGSTLGMNNALNSGLKRFEDANKLARPEIDLELKMLNDFTDSLAAYRRQEVAQLGAGSSCAILLAALQPLKTTADANLSTLVRKAVALPIQSVTDLRSVYQKLETAATKASDLSGAVKQIAAASRRTIPIVEDVNQNLEQFARQAGQAVHSEYESRRDAVDALDANYLGLSTNNLRAYESRWRLYQNVCNLEDMSTQHKCDPKTIHNAAMLFADLKADPVLGRTAGVFKQRVLAALDADVRGRLRFPVRLSADPTRPMTPQELVEFSSLLNGLHNELQDPGWQTADPNVLASLTKNCEDYVRVAGSLVGEDGKPAAIEVYFVPPEPGRRDDRTITGIFRDVNVTIGSRASDLDTSTVNPDQVPRWKGTIDQGITISLVKGKSSRAPVKKEITEPDWGLVRLIQDGKAVSDDFKEWTIKVPLEDSQGSNRYSGNATFKVSLKQPLVKIDDWRKLK